MKNRNRKIVYSFHSETNEYCGTAIAWESPLELGIYHLPAFSTEIQPKPKENQKSFWRNNKWEYEDITFPKIEDKPESTEEKKNRIKSELISQRKSYLSKTDWLIFREFDQPNSYPRDIKEKRILARQEISQITDAKTLKELNHINTNFQL